jgi:WD40 repeat protein
MHKLGTARLRTLLIAAVLTATACSPAPGATTRSSGGSPTGSVAPTWTAVPTTAPSILPSTAPTADVTQAGGLLLIRRTRPAERTEAESVYALLDVATGREIDLGVAFDAAVIGDRSRVLAVRHDDSCIPTLATIDASGHIVDMVSGFRLGDRLFASSWDGRRIAVVSDHVPEKDWCYSQGGPRTSALDIRVASAEHDWKMGLPILSGIAPIDEIAWSPDGSAFAIADDESRKLLLVDVASGTATDLTTVLSHAGIAGDLPPHPLVWSPDGSTLAFNYDAGDFKRIGFMELASRVVTTAGAHNESWAIAGYAPTGHALAFVRETDQASALALLDRGHTPSEPLATGVTPFIEALWSADGSWLAVQYDDGSIGIVRADGSGSGQVLPPSSGAQLRGWLSP